VLEFQTGAEAMRSNPTLILLAATCLIGCDELQHVSYTTSADAVAAAAIARGWLPDLLSTGVCRIQESHDQEAHDLDTIHGVADFRYAPELILQLQQRCTPRPDPQPHLDLSMWRFYHFA